MTGNPQQLIAGTAHDRQILLQIRVFRVRKQRQDGGRDRQKTGQRCGNGLRRVAEDGKGALLLVGRGDEQHQRPVNRLRDGAEMRRAGMQLQRGRALQNVRGKGRAIRNVRSKRLVRLEKRNR